MNIEARFEKFDRENPHAWELFKKFTFQMIERGMPRYSARTIIHLIRWHTDMWAMDEEGFKINNSYSPYYARKFEKEFPSYTGFFEKRVCAADREAIHA